MSRPSDRTGATHVAPRRHGRYDDAEAPAAIPVSTQCFPPSVVVSRTGPAPERLPARNPVLPSGKPTPDTLRPPVGSSAAAVATVVHCTDPRVCVTTEPSASTAHAPLPVSASAVGDEARADGSCVGVQVREAPTELRTGDTVSAWYGRTPTAARSGAAARTSPPSVGTATGVAFLTVRHPSAVLSRIQRTPLGQTASPCRAPVIWSECRFVPTVDPAPDEPHAPRGSRHAATTTADTARRLTGAVAGRSRSARHSWAPGRRSPCR